LGVETSEWSALAAYILRMAGYVVEEIRIYS